MSNIAIVFAGGVGQRAGDSPPKQFAEVAGQPIICHTLRHFEDHPAIAAIYVACLTGWEDELASAAAAVGISKLRRVVPGGASAQASSRNALLAALADWQPDDLAVIHDGVRPIITAGLIDELLLTAAQHGNAVTCRPVAETPILSRDGQVVDELIDRDFSYVAQAPQVFPLGRVVAAHEAMLTINPDYAGVVDTASLMHGFGDELHLVVGNPGNLKITWPSDLDFFRGWLAR